MDEPLTSDRLMFFTQSGEFSGEPRSADDWQRAWLEAKMLHGKMFRRMQELSRELRAIEADRDALADRLAMIEGE